LDEDLVGGGGVEAALDDVEKFLAVVGNSAAGPTHGEGGADDRRQSDLGERQQGLAHRVLLIALAALLLAGVPFQLVAGQDALLVPRMDVERIEARALGE